jgi:hypothetical protein
LLAGGVVRKQVDVAGVRRVDRSNAGGPGSELFELIGIGLIGEEIAGECRMVL